MRTLSILGSTGSIGRSTLDIVSRHRDQFRIEVLTAGRNRDLLARQIREFRPRIAALENDRGLKELAKAVAGTGCRVVGGKEGVLEAAAEKVDLVVSAISGGSGFLPTLAALRAGSPVALANKESLVMGGELVMSEARRQGIVLFPIDSEHSALFQCLQGWDRRDVAEIILTASGGPFWNRPPEDQAHFTPAEALNHPRWSMGPKVTIDSATMMNKGLEVIEAHWLFEMDYDRIKVAIHPQSLIHSLVRFKDGSLLAQIGPADMRLPISLALFYPRRWESPLKPLDLIDAGPLTFSPPAPDRFPLLDLAYHAGHTGGTAPTVLSVANEEAVTAFLEETISFPDIAACVQEILAEHQVEPILSEEDVLTAADWARRKAQEWITGR